MSTAELPPIPLDSVAIAHHVRLTWGVPVAPATIRKWGQRGVIRRLPGPRNARYDLREVLAHLRALGWIPPD